MHAEQCNKLQFCVHIAQCKKLYVDVQVEQSIKQFMEWLWSITNANCRSSLCSNRWDHWPTCSFTAMPWNAVKSQHRVCISKPLTKQPSHHIVGACLAKCNCFVSKEAKTQMKLFCKSQQLGQEVASCDWFQLRTHQLTTYNTSNKHSVSIQSNNLLASRVSAEVLGRMLMVLMSQHTSSPSSALSSAAFTVSTSAFLLNSWVGLTPFCSGSGRVQSCSSCWMAVLPLPVLMSFNILTNSGLRCLNTCIHHMYACRSCTNSRIGVWSKLWELHSKCHVLLRQIHVRGTEECCNTGLWSISTPNESITISYETQIRPSSAGHLKSIAVSSQTTTTTTGLSDLAVTQPTKSAMKGVYYWFCRPCKSLVQPCCANMQPL